MKSTLNPELLLMLNRNAVSVNQKAVNLELKATYCRKAWRCGMSLDGYCSRFGIRKVWEGSHDANTTESSE